MAQPKFLRVQGFPNAHPLIKTFFLKKEIPNIPTARRFNIFVKTWQKVTTDPVILSYVEGYKIPLVEIPSQNSSPPPVLMKEEEKMTIQEEREEKLKEKTKAQCKTSIGICKLSFHSTEEIFRISTNNNFEEPKLLCQVQPFQNELLLLNELLENGDHLCKLDLKGTCFSVPLHQDSQKYIKFQWKQKLYPFLCLCFGLDSAPRVFTKLMKVPIAILRRLNILLVLYSANCEVSKRIDYGKGYIGFSVTKSKFSDKFREISAAVLPEDRIFGNSCGLQIYGTHSSTIGSKCNNRSASVASLNRSSDSAGNCLTDWKTKLLWRSSSAGPSLQVPRKAANSGVFNADKLREKSLFISRRPWSNLETKEHINILLKAAKSAILSFTKISPQAKIIHLQMGNIVALSYSAKMEGTYKKVL